MSGQWVPYPWYRVKSKFDVKRGTVDLDWELEWRWRWEPDMIKLDIEKPRDIPKVETDDELKPYEFKFKEVEK